MPSRSVVTPFENLWTRIGEFLPNFLAAFVLLVIGVAIALGARFLVIKLLNSIGWEKLAKKTPAFRFLAVVIVALGAWIGRLFGKFARAFAHAARIPEANLLGKGVQYLVIVVALGTALEQLNVATRFLLGAFLIVLGSLGLAFGLGGQGKAREIIERISRVEEKAPG